MYLLKYAHQKQDQSHKPGCTDYEFKKSTKEVELPQDYSSLIQFLYKYINGPSPTHLEENIIVNNNEFKIMKNSEVSRSLLQSGKVIITDPGGDKIVIRKLYSSSGDIDINIYFDSLKLDDIFKFFLTLDLTKKVYKTSEALASENLIIKICSPGAEPAPPNQR